ncbi:hypothetical protein [Streptomyces kebangsaanensis]|uniref:hypothetical protein n=1 Tax=Streptomyces kebangsaanensis TaxID=864058 RepID=UPI0009A12209|nr:hypothetical protein [Streptomyces kebangsaanensis]
MPAPEQQPDHPSATDLEPVQETAGNPASAPTGPMPAMPYHPPAMPYHPPATPASRWSRLSRATVLAIGAGLGAAVVGACWAGMSLADGNETNAPEAAASSSPSATADQAEDTKTPFSTDGTLTVAGVGADLDSGELCSGTGGYSDIDLGTQVTITDAAGTLVAVGSLGFGQKTEQGCEFPFTVDDITPGSKFYTVEISHRGGLTKTEDQLREGELAFTLGD